jgi:hypothetical protein
MYLINKQQNAAFAFGDLLDHSLEALFKLAFVFRAGNQGAHIQAVDRLVEQVFGDITRDDTVGDSLGYGGFSNTWLTDENGVVFGAPG